MPTLGVPNSRLSHPDPCRDPCHTLVPFTKKEVIFQWAGPLLSPGPSLVSMAPHCHIPAVPPWACFSSPCQADGESLEGFYLLAAFVTFANGSQGLSSISDRTPRRGKTPQPLSLDALLSLSFWCPLRISHLLTLHPPTSCFLHFSVLSPFTPQPQTAWLPRLSYPHFLLPPSLSSDHPPPQLPHTSRSSVHEHHFSSFELSAAKRGPWGERSAIWSMCVTAFFPTKFS